MSFEISKKFVPFSELGKDGGIDGFYVCPYNGNNGKWRFQYKYHDPRVAVSALTQDMKEEMVKVQGEDFFILLTNLKVGPKKNAKLIEEGQVALRKLGKREIDLEVWDEAKIFRPIQLILPKAG